jgi:hypothetical protein
MRDQEKTLGSPSKRTLSENILIYECGALAAASFNCVPEFDHHLEKDEKQP